MFPWVSDPGKSYGRAARSRYGMRIRNCCPGMDAPGRGTQGATTWLINNAGPGRVEPGLPMKTKTHFVSRVDAWDDTGNSIVEHCRRRRRSHAESERTTNHWC